MENDANYPDGLIDRLELIWGQGFLSPGGAEELPNILRGVETRDKSVLDIGCGVAGAACMIADDFQARHVVGIDVEDHLIARGNANVAAAGLADRVHLQRVDPGPLPFEAAAFDMVFSKDVLVHVPDKPAMYAEIFRVLKPGGRFAASDWLVGENADEMPEYQEYRAATGLHLHVQTAAQIEAIMWNAGFAAVRLEDYHARYARRANAEVAALEGPLKSRLLEVTDAATYRHTVAVRRANAAAAACGALQPTYLWGEKPAN